MEIKDKSDDLIAIACTYKGATAKARLVCIDGVDYWVAKSISTIEIPITLHVPDWWMNDKNKAVRKQDDDEPS